MKRTWILGIVAVILFANAFLIVYLRNRNVVSMDHHFQMPANEAFDEAVRRLVEPLRGQSLEESLNMLDRIEYYMFSGAAIGDSPFTIDDRGRYRLGLDQQNVILSNRAFRKCLQEIKLLPPKEAAQLIEKHLDSALSAWGDAYASGASPTVSSEGKDGKPVLRGMRFKVLALLLIAGTCELTDCHAAVRKVANFSLEQKRNIPEFETPLQQLFFLSEVSLWNPIILSAGLYGTHPRKNSPEFKNFADRYAEHQIVDYK